MAFLVPDVIFKNVTHITPEFLHRRGIKGLALDVDNTLTGHGSHDLSPEIEAWLCTMKESGIKLMLASNNTRNRVEPFAQKIGLEYASMCCKPAPKWLWHAKQRFGLPRKAIALVGDQLFTDLLAGSLWGVQVFLVRPLYEDTKPTIRLKRKLEKPLILRYYKKGGQLL